MKSLPTPTIIRPRTRLATELPKPPTSAARVQAAIDAGVGITATTHQPEPVKPTHSEAVEAAIALQGALVPTISEMQERAKIVFTENKKMNAAKGKYDKERAALFAQMLNAKCPGFSFLATLEDGTNVSLNVLRGAREQTVIDTAKLLEIVGMEMFMTIVQASSKAVVEHVGGAIATQCSVTEMGEENVSVKAAK